MGETNYCCGCLGYGYVPVQQLETVLCPEDGLMQGSIFPELILTINEYGKICKGGGKIYDAK